MFDDGRSLRGTIETDLCIVGGGAAGITLANRLADAGLRIVLLESGGDEPDGDIEGLNLNATVSGLQYPLGSSRLRFLGGTTNHWSGNCYRFRASDFTPRSFLPLSGWPISFGDVGRYYDEAASLALFRDEAPNWNTDDWRRKLHTKAWPISSSAFVTPITFLAPPNDRTGLRSFAQYCQPLKGLRNVRVIQRASAVEFVHDAGGASIDRVEAKSFGGAPFSIRARRFILACGGVENPRLLLASRRRNPRGIGNEYDQVGRYFTDHLLIHESLALNPRVAPDKVIWRRTHDRRTQTVGSYLASDELVMRENLHNVFLRVEPVEGEVNTGAAAARRIWGSIRKGRVESVAKSDISSAMSNLGDVGEWATDHAYCGVEPAAYTVGARVEPDPHPESRVTLTNEKDALGMPIANLHWAISDDVKRSTFRTLELFAREVGKHNIGRMRIFFDPTAPWPEWPDMEVGFHHCSTTRMSDTPKTGVVDRNCRVHGVSNLYVAGSSVFSTAGSGSPTMMLTALALRLADHIKADMG